jgi:hypothetical protein
MGNGQKTAPQKEAATKRPEIWCMQMAAAAIYFRHENARADEATRVNAMNRRMRGAVPQRQNETEPRKIDVSPGFLRKMLMKQSVEAQQTVVSPPAPKDLERIMNSPVGNQEELAPDASFNITPYLGGMTANKGTVKTYDKMVGGEPVAKILARELNSLLKVVTPLIEVRVAEQGTNQGVILDVVDGRDGSVFRSIQLPPGSHVFITRNPADNSVSVMTMTRGENQEVYTIMRFLRTPSGLDTPTATHIVERNGTVTTERWSG